MGDYSISCALSGLALQEQEVMFFPLVRTETKIKGAYIIGSNATAKTLFTPYTLPIPGHLDSYGNLCLVPNGAEADAITRAFNQRPEFLARDCTFGEQVKIYGKTQTGVGCFVDKRLYDRLSKSPPKELSSLYVEYFNANPEFYCKALGGKETITPKLYDFPDYGLQIQFGAGQETKLKINETEHRFWYISDLDKEINLPESFVKKAKELVPYQLWVKKDLEQLTNDLKKKDEKQKIYDSLDESDESQILQKRDLLLELSQYPIRHEKMRLQSSFGLVAYRYFMPIVEEFDPIYFWNLWDAGLGRDPALLESLFKYWNFVLNMSQANRLLMPTACYTQYPDPEATLYYNDVINEVLIESVSKEEEF